jgi:hypothetical protein
MPRAGRALIHVLDTFVAWLLFVGGSIAVQTIDSHARLPAQVFLGAQALHACVAIVFAFRGTRALRHVALRVGVVACQAAVGFVVFAMMMLAHSCALGDCL